MQQQTSVPQNFDFSFAPALKMYMDSLESWRENCEKIVQQTQLLASNQNSALSGSAHERPFEGWQKMAETMFRGFVERQIEFCHFMGHRWERYLDMPARVAQCKTPADLVQLESEFVTRMAQDYADQGTKLTRPFAELAGNWPMGRTAY